MLAAVISLLGINACLVHTRNFLAGNMLVAITNYNNTPITLPARRPVGFPQKTCWGLPPASLTDCRKLITLPHPPSALNGISMTISHTDATPMSPVYAGGVPRPSHRGIP